MNKLSFTIIALLSSSWVYAADITIPKDAVLESGTNNTQGLFNKNSPPNSSDLADYETWFQKNAESVRNNLFSGWAIAKPDSLHNKCIAVAGAFSFKQVSDSQYEVTCLAGPNGKALTHVMQYEADYHYYKGHIDPRTGLMVQNIPLVSCSPPSKADIDKVFKDDKLRNAAQAVIYDNMMANSCGLFVKTQPISQKSFRLSDTDIEKYLKGDDNLSTYLSSNASANIATSKQVKAGHSGKDCNSLLNDCGFTNPAAVVK